MVKNILLEKMDHGRKPNMNILRRGVSQAKLTESLMEIILNVNKTEIKDVLLRVKIEDSYDKNVKSLGPVDANVLKETLVTLRDIEKRDGYTHSPDDFLKCGLIHEIVDTITRMIVYKCDQCCIEVKHSNGMKTHPCVRCGVLSCPACHGNLSGDQVYICKICVEDIREARRIPT